MRMDAHLDPSVSLSALDVELEASNVEAELCVVGGAVVILAFDAKPETRRIRALFKATSLVRDAADRVQEARSLPTDWLTRAVRSLLASSSGRLGSFFEGSNLRVFEAPPDYVLAMRCASFHLEPRDEAEADLRYLLRSLDVYSAAGAKSRIGRYFTERQLPEGLSETLSRLLA